MFSRKFYIYAYLRSTKTENGDVGTPYYIGKGTARRAFKKESKERIRVPSDKKNIIILFDFLTEEESFDLERDLISGFGRIDLGTGCLRNLTSGGEGCSGLVRTETHKENIKQSHLRIGMIKPVRCLTDGKVYQSATQAARELSLSVSAQTKISACCLGNRITAYGHGWEFVDGSTPNRTRIDNNKDKRVAVYSIEISTGKRTEYSSVWAAAIATGSTSYAANIRRCLYEPQRTAYGHEWRIMPS